jgi:hypothetical protein
MVAQSTRLGCQGQVSRQTSWLLAATAADFFAGG